MIKYSFKEDLAEQKRHTVFLLLFFLLVCRMRQRLCGRTEEEEEEEAGRRGRRGRRGQRGRRGRQGRRGGNQTKSVVLGFITFSVKLKLVIPS